MWGAGGCRGLRRWRSGALWRSLRASRPRELVSWLASKETRQAREETILAVSRRPPERISRQGDRPDQQWSSIRREYGTMLAEKFILLIETLRSRAHPDDSPTGVTTSPHVPAKLPNPRAD